MDQVSEVQLLGANILFGGVSAGVVALFRGEPLGRAFAKGVAGGAVTYGGKRIAVERWFGAGLIGRQVGLLGGSMINNAGAGRGTFERIAFGLGPTRWYLDREHAGVQWGVDVPAVAGLIWGILDSDDSLDLTESLSSGAVVFAGQGEHALPGTIFYSRGGGPERASYVLAHERVHILQYDQTFLALGEPFESWLGRYLPDLGTPFDMEFNALSLASAFLLAARVWPVHAQQPWEREAIFLGRLR
jgi:hypothetical protein